ncbi:MAG: hypothetical protein HBSAPP03_13020 [Phycisphaerae bacterium]|nr:MAG: hypothetical protein HBSAPP03_13020 [Phycisphaerae bacterium]
MAPRAPRHLHKHFRSEMGSYLRRGFSGMLPMGVRRNWPRPEEAGVRELVVQNLALDYLESRVPSVHEHAAALMRVTLINLRTGTLDGVPLDPVVLDRMRFDAAWHASPSSIAPVRPDWQLLADDLSYAVGARLDVYVATSRWTLPTAGFWAKLFSRRPALKCSLLYYVEPATDEHHEEIHVIHLNAWLLP